MAKTLNQAGLVRIGQLAEVRPEQLSLFAGKGARQLWEFAHGIDERPVISEPPAAKSYSEQETFAQDVTDEDWILAKLRSIADRLLAKVRGDGKAIRTVEVRVRYNDFDECRRSESLNEPTDLESEVYPTLYRLLKKAWERRVSLRLVSVKVSGVYDGVFQAGLPLVNAGVDTAQQRRAAVVVDRLRARYGAGAVMRGHDLFLQRYGEAAKPPPAAVIHKKGKVEWAALNCRSGYSFLDSLLMPEHVVRLAVERGCRAVALTDPNLHGAVEFFIAAKDAGIKPVIGAEITVGNVPYCAYVRDRTGYVNLCALMSLPSIRREDFQDRREGLILRPTGFLPQVRYGSPRDKPMFDILQAIRTLSLADEQNPAKRTGIFHFPSGNDLAGSYAEAARDSLEISEQCDFEFELGGLRFPRYQPKDGSTARSFLRRLTIEGAHRRYGRTGPIPARILSQIEEELRIIAEVGYEEYFLLVWDILEDCKLRGIEWITRGSAADSLVCYCLGISDVCPIRFELYFRRFLNRDRMVLNKLPDIDIDFAVDRKDDVVDLIFDKYGEHAAIVGGFNTFRGRSAFADIAKVMGVSEYQVRRMTERIPWTDASHVEEAVAYSQECRDGTFEEDPYKTALRLAHRLDGFPRHPKMHPCGVVLSRLPVMHLSPVFTSAKGYPTTHFDMEQVEAIGLVKIDILAQAGLAVMRDTKELLRKRGVTVDLKALEPWEDKEVWRMIASGNARGVHHIESPAMCTLERMVNVNNIDDLIAIVSVIRPGAANSMRKESFANRAQGIEPVEYAHPSLEPVLRSTYGVIAYEEHILQICEAFAGMTAGRADFLRRALVKIQPEKVQAMLGEFVSAAKERGRTDAEIAAVWKLLIGFMGYAFCRAHSTAYGVEAYEAAHLKRYYPAEFLSCVLTHGKGFYSRLVYSLECRRLGIGFLLPDVNLSSDAYFPERGSIRVPLCQISGISAATLERWRAGKPFESLRDFYLRVRPSTDEMNNLIRVGAFDSFGESRTTQFWEFRELAQWPHVAGQGLLLGGEKPVLPLVPLSEPDRTELLKAETELLGFAVSGHPLDLYSDVQWNTYCPIADVGNYPTRRVTVAGMIVEDRLHHQMDGRIMKFISICDYSGILECELFASAYRRFGVETIRHPIVEVSGKVKPFANSNGYTLQVEAVRRARTLR